MSMKLLRYKLFENIVDIDEKADLLLSMAVGIEPEIENWPAAHALASLYMRRFTQTISIKEMAKKFIEVYNKRKDKFFFGKDQLKEFESIPNKHEMGIAFKKDAENWIGIFDVDRAQYQHTPPGHQKRPGYYKGPDRDEAIKVALGIF
jgi:hypothetical protein